MTPSPLPARVIRPLVTLVAGAAAVAALLAFTRPDEFVAAARAADAAFDLEAFGTRTSASAPPLDGVRHAWFVSLIVLAQAGFAIALAWRAAHRPDARALALFMTALAVAEGHSAYAVQSLGLDWRVGYRATWIATFAALAAFLRFAAHFPVALTPADVLTRPGGRPVGAIRRRLWPALLRPPLVWGAAALLALPTLLGDTLGGGTTLLFALLLPWTVVQGVRMLRAGRRVAEPALRRRALWIVQGFVAGLAVLAAAISLQLVAAQFPRSATLAALAALPLYNLVTVLFVAGCAMAAFYDGGVDPALTIRRTAVYGALGLAVAFLFSGIEGVVGGVMVRTLGLSDAGATWFAGGASALLVGAVRARAESLGARLLGPWLPERTLAELPADDAVVVVVDPCDTSGDADPIARLAALHALARREVPRFGGTIALVVGDAVVLTFDTPEAATRAVEALRASWATERGPLRVGVQAGRVVRVPEGGLVGPALAQADLLRRQAAG